MLLSSSLEPNGPKSTHHYIVLHHEDKRELIKLPESYSDLKREVKSAYQIDDDRFHVETRELNICAGESIKIPEEAWGDLSKLIGNLYVVPCAKETLKPLENKVPLEKTEEPLKSEETPKTEEPLKTEQALKNNLKPTLETEMLKMEEPLKSKKAFGSEVSLENKVPLKNQEPLKTEELKTVEPLKREEGSDSHPESFPGPEAIRSSPPPSTHAVFSLQTTAQAGPDMINIDKNVLYEQILACDPRVSGALADIREEINLYKHSKSEIKWRSWQVSPDTWTDFAWEVRPRSIVAARYNLTEASSKMVEVRFSVTAIEFNFYIDLYENGGVFFGESLGPCYKFFQLSHSMHAAGDHSIALVNHGGQIHAFFDFKEFTIVPGVPLISQGSDSAYVSQGFGPLEVDVYDFD